MLYFPHTGTLDCMVCLAPQLPLLVHVHVNVGRSCSTSCCLTCPVLQPLPCCESSLPQLPISAPPTSLDECFFFNSLVVRLPYSSDFCQFWVFFVFKFVVVLLLVLRGGKVYLLMSPSWPEVLANFLKDYSDIIILSTVKLYLNNNYFFQGMTYITLSHTLSNFFEKVFFSK